MGINNNCPKCHSFTIQVVDHVFQIRGGLELWRECETCKHRWKEVYVLDLLHSNQPWDKPPHNEEDD